MNTNFFSENIPEGTAFESRAEIKDVGLHKHLVHGISANEDGAFSVVVAGGYVDDEDFGDEIIYTGQGGRDEKTGKHIKNQELVSGNKALVINHTQGFPVRVIRKKDSKNPYAPIENYRYDGLYTVDDHWREKGKEGFYVYRFKLVKIKEISSYQVPKKIDIDLSKGNDNPQRKESIAYRVIRDTKLSKDIKTLYEYKCQVCGIQIETDGGFYAEAAHIRALGKPHNGKDTPDNILCLCPNHHVMFDKYVFYITEGYDLVGKEVSGKLFVHEKHQINKEFLNYHRELSDNLV